MPSHKRMETLCPPVQGEEGGAGGFGGIPCMVMFVGSSVNSCTIPYRAKNLWGAEVFPARTLLGYNRVVLTPRNGWMRSGCAVDAQRMHSGRAALRLLWLKQKKTGVPMTPPQNCLKILLTPHHLPLREFLPEIGAKSRKSPQFRPSSLPCSN